MKTNQKGFANLVVLIGVVLVLIAVGGYFVWSKKTTSTNTNSVASKMYSETEILASLKTNWPSIQSVVLVDIQPRSGVTEAMIEHLKKTFTAPAAVQFIGNNNLLIRVNDMEADWTAVFNYDGKMFNFKETAWKQGGGTTSLPQSEWEKLITKYGDPSYVVSSYNNTGTYTSLTPGFEYLVKVPQNVFIRSEPTSTLAVDQTTNWKTYTNKTYVFKFKYPEDWQIETASFAGDNTVFAKPVSEQATCFAEVLPTDCITIAVDPSSNGDLSYFEKNSTTKNDLTIGGKAAKQFMIKSSVIVIIPLGGKPILSVSHLSSSNYEIFSKMLTTFEFTK